MKKNIITLSFIICSLSMFSQNENSSKEYQRIILDGKTAYMNIKTREIVANKPEDSVKKTNTSRDIKTKTASKFHIIKPGENLFSISKMYDLTIDELKQMNPYMDESTIKPRQQIVVNSSIVNRIDKPVYTAKTEVPNNMSNTYIVVKGDTLYSLSKRFNIDLSYLKKINNLESNLISIGQKLIVK